MTDTKFPLNLALLYYENPSGNMSVLLQRKTSMRPGWHPWFNITSQKSQSLPADFRNSPDESDYGHTIYEADANTIYSAPFTSRINFTREDSAITALSYAPRNASVVAWSYLIGPSQNGNISGGMHWVSSYPEWLFIN